MTGGHILFTINIVISRIIFFEIPISSVPFDLKSMLYINIMLIHPY